jgi:hypothetical protein
MPIPLEPGPRPDRVADIVLRGPSRRLRARVRWPDVSAPTSTALVVLLHHEGALVWEADRHAAALSEVYGAVVLSTWPDAAAEATAIVEWVADHGAELGADPRRLIVAADGRACAIAVKVVRQAHDDGWPPIDSLVLVHPKGDLASGPGGSLTDLPPTTVVARSADQLDLFGLRAGGAVVTELVADDPTVSLAGFVHSLRGSLDGADRPSTATVAAPGSRP